MPDSGERLGKRPSALRQLARIALSIAAVTLFVPLLGFVSIARALYQRLVRGKASDILRVRQGPYRAGVFYGAQMVFDKPFDSSKLRDAFFELVEEAGIDRAKARLEFEAETPRAFPASGALEADHYVEQGTNWVKRGKDFKGVVLWLRVFTGNAGTPTVLQAGLPGGSWDGSSCFNFMKELVSRCCGGPRGDVFQGNRLALRPASVRVLDQSLFLAFLLRLPRDVAFNTWSPSSGTWPARPARWGAPARAQRSRFSTLTRLIAPGWKPVPRLAA